MPPNQIPYLIEVAVYIFTVLSVFGLPALAVVLIKFIKFKERELTLEMEFRQKSQQQGLATEQWQLAFEQRVQRLEEVLTTLDHDVRDRLGIESSHPTSLSSHPEFLEGPAPDAPAREVAGPVLTKVR